MDFDEIIPIVLPKTLTENQLPDAEELMYWQNRANRQFWIQDEINTEENDGTKEQIILLEQTIIQLNNEDADKSVEDRKPIILFINSYGGDLTLANSLVDIIEASITPVYTVAISATMSAAFLIFLAGKKRFHMPHAEILCHSGYAQLGGSASEVQEASQNYKNTLQKMKTFILSHTQIPEKIYNKNQKKDWYFTETELKDYAISVPVTSLADIK